MVAAFLLVLIPAAGAVAVWATPGRRLARRRALAAAAAAAAICAMPVPVIGFLVGGETSWSWPWLEAGTTLHLGVHVDGLTAVLLAIGMLVTLLPRLLDLRPGSGGATEDAPRRLISAAALAGLILAGSPVLLLAFWLVRGLAIRRGHPAVLLADAGLLVPVLTVLAPVRPGDPWSDLAVLLLILAATMRISSAIAAHDLPETAAAGVAGVYVVLRLMPLVLESPERLVVLGGIGAVAVLLAAALDRWCRRRGHADVGGRRPSVAVLADRVDQGIRRRVLDGVSAPLDDLAEAMRRVSTGETGRIVRFVVVVAVVATTLVLVVPLLGDVAPPSGGP